MGVENEIESYTGKIDVEFDGLPSVKLVSVIHGEQSSWIQRLSRATVRRFFTLQSDWKICISNITYCKEINGEIVIPREVDNKLIHFDGASVPFPWIVSFLSLGILRPLGVMLTASIVHDFAFKFGWLFVQEKGNPDSRRREEVRREDVDKLFRDTITTVNRLYIVGWLAWYFVRLGWFFGVPYAGKRFNVKDGVPYGIGLTFLAGLACLVSYLFDCYGFSFVCSGFSVDRFNTLITWVAVLYLFGYVITLVLAMNAKEGSTGNTTEGGN